jgi:nucleotide-binding universal stress UspA family protein
MPHLTHIVAPVEIHENATPVVQWAALLAQRTGSRLTLLHVNEALELAKTRPGLQVG